MPGEDIDEQKQRSTTSTFITQQDVGMARGKPLQAAHDNSGTVSNGKLYVGIGKVVPSYSRQLQQRILSSTSPFWPGTARA